jgi:hypothetical protein
MGATEELARAVGLKQVKREDRDLGVLAVRAGQVPILAVVQVLIAQVPRS